MQTFTILTGPLDELLAPIHNDAGHAAARGLALRLSEKLLASLPPDERHMPKTS